MQSIPPITGHRAQSVLRRRWRSVASIVGALIVIAVLAAHPWTGGSTPMNAAAQSRVAGASAAPPKPRVVNGALQLSLNSKGTVPGKAPKIPWPDTGQAGISLMGAGLIGVSGKQTAVPTASMAKAMTAYIVLTDHPLVGNESGPTIHVTQAEADALANEQATDQQTLTVRAGEAITEKQALDALLLKSANNVARILGRWDAGSVDAFLTKMNATAAKLGMTSTHYTDPSGWHATTVSTTTDQIRLGETAMKRADFAKIVATTGASVPIEGWVSNVNNLLGQDGIVGIKTGSMSAAGGCLMFAAKHTVDHKTVTIVGTVMDQRSGAIGDLHEAFASSKTLVEAVENILDTHEVIKAGDVVGTVPGTSQQLVAAKSVSVIGWSGMSYSKTITASIPKTAKPGSTVGTLAVSGGASVTVPVALKSTVPAASPSTTPAPAGANQ